jgi:hypothetical protein
LPDDKNKEDKPKILIDSDWKDEAEREKDELAGKAKPDANPEDERGPLPPPDFLQHCASLATHAMILLGAVPNPMTGEKEFDPAYARHMIDTIVMLRDKAKGNLTPEEEKTLEHLVGELRMAWVSVAGPEKRS